jgi:hypothetical protein
VEFQVKHAPQTVASIDAGEGPFWMWQLVKKEDGVVCASGRTFTTEKEARSNIAAAKKTMRGAGRSKVVTY